MGRTRSRHCRISFIFSSSPTPTASASHEGASNCTIETLHRCRLSFFTSVLLVAFLFKESQSSSNWCSYGDRNMMTSIQCTSCTRKLTCATPTMKPMRAATFAWIASHPYCREKSTPTTRKSVGAFYDERHQRRYSTIRQCRSHSSFSSLFTHPDSKQLDLMQTRQLSIKPSQSTSIANNMDQLENIVQHDGHHWFTQLLPEGWCVGVCTGRASASAMLNNEDKSIPNNDVSTLLHDEEYEWGQNNIASDTSRASHYLGRMALRSSLKILLDSERDSERSESVEANNNTQENTTGSFYDQLFDRIRTTAIKKDYYGRPILPEIILGSISHKGEYAVGLARFRSSTSNGPNNRVFMGLDGEKIGDGPDPLDASAVQWREECPIFYEDDNADEFSYSSKSLSDGGVGIDLERIDAGRGKRIQRKVLTESEQKGLGSLEAIGISSEEEVMLRFSLKESVYKAMHPIICHYVGFQEAEITPLSDGTAKVTLNLTSNAHEHLGIVVQSASWKKIGDFFLTSASVGIGK